MHDPYALPSDKTLLLRCAAGELMVTDTALGVDNTGTLLHLTRPKYAVDIFCRAEAAPWYEP